MMRSLVLRSGVQPRLARTDVGVASCPSITFERNLAARRIRTKRTAGDPRRPALLPSRLHPSPGPSGLHGCAEETICLLATGSSSR